MNYQNDINKIRADFPILQTSVYGKPLIYLDNAATTQKPQSVLDLMLSFYSESYGNIHRGNYLLSEKASDLYESARETVRKFIKANNSQEIVFTSGTTSSINLVAQSFGNSQIRQGDNVVITEMEHHSNLLPWQMVCKNKGAILKVIPFDDNGALNIELLDTIITEKTKLIAITHISNVTGVINPVKKIIAYAHSREIPVLIDGAQSISHESIDVTDLDCDFYAFSGHKMYAETGTGVLYGKEKWLELMPPYQTGGGMALSVDFEKPVFSELPFKFEAGTQNIAGTISIAGAIKYLGNIGLDTIHTHEKQLLQYASDCLSKLDGVILYAESVEKSGILSFNIIDRSSYDVSAILDKLGIAVRSGTHCAQPVMKHFGIKSTIRVSFALYNTSDEIDMLVHGIKKAQQILH